MPGRFSEEVFTNGMRHCYNAYLLSLDGTNRIYFSTQLLPKLSLFCMTPFSSYLLTPSLPELQQTSTHKLCILCEMSNSIFPFMRTLFMVKCVNYILFILCFFFSFFSVVLSLCLSYRVRQICRSMLVFTDAPQ